MLRLVYIVIVFFAVLFVAVPSYAEPAAARKEAKVLHFADTLHSAKKQAQFEKALVLAPDVFVYDQFIRESSSSVTVKGMKFNDSMKNTLASEFTADDPGLAKRLKRLSRLTRPLNAVCDLTVNYHRVPEGIAVEYIIRNISVFGFGKVPDALLQNT